MGQRVSGDGDVYTQYGGSVPSRSCLGMDRLTTCLVSLVHLIILPPLVFLHEFAGNLLCL